MPLRVEELAGSKKVSPYGIWVVVWAHGGDDNRRGNKGLLIGLGMKVIVVVGEGFLFVSSRGWYAHLIPSELLAEILNEVDESKITVDTLDLVWNKMQKDATSPLLKLGG